MEVIAKPVALHLHPFHRVPEKRVLTITDDLIGFGDEDEAAVTLRLLALRLEAALRDAKKAHLDCGQVLLPPDLLTRIASDMVRMAETEPCGLRGALVLLHFDFAPSSSTSSSTTVNEIGQLRGDPHLPPTFQLHLTLREEEAPWYSRLPKILRNWTKGRTLIVGAGYTLAKRKLYRSASH